MNEQEIQAAAQALADQHMKDIAEARANLVRDMVAAGYKPDEWVICDNILDIQAGKTYDYCCWSSRKYEN
jgi:hypothetical protein